MSPIVENEWDRIPTSKPVATTVESPGHLNETFVFASHEPKEHAESNQTAVFFQKQTEEKK